MVSKTDDVSHDPFSREHHPQTPALPRLDDIGDTAFTLSQRVADANGNLVRPEGHPVVAENPADVPFPEHDEPETPEESDEKTFEEERETAPEPTVEEEPSVEEQLNFNLEEENK